MALSPGIPTSFVPKQPVQPTRRSMSTGSSLFLIVGVVIAGLMLAMAVGVFAYNKYLESTLSSKQAQLTEAQAKVDDNVIEEFVRLRDRLTTGKDLLTNHAVLSQFFDTLEGLTLQNVRFDSLKLNIAGDHTAKLQMKGSARNFNALAAQSNAFATDKRIKRAIFSGITLGQDKLVQFELTADIDPKLIIEGSGANAVKAVTPAQVQKPVTASTTPVSTSSTTPAAAKTTTTQTVTVPPPTQ